MNGPLAGLRVVEIAALGPTPFAAMWLAEMGAEVLRIQRPGLRHLLDLDRDTLDRARDWIELDLKSPEDHAIARQFIAGADALIEGMRPGVMERLGLGPEDFPDNPRLVYGRMTGWGQHGPLAATAGHDITYLAVSGMLHPIGPADQPSVPLNLLGDFAGGSMYLVAGMLAALWQARSSGLGQVVDAAIVDGAAHLGAMIWGMHAQGAWSDRRSDNLLDGAAPHYRCYRCADGRHVAVGALEPKFYAALLDGLELDAKALPDRADRARWSELAAILGARFASAPRDHWAQLFAATDACVAPVLSLAEVPGHAHHRARGRFAPVGRGAEPEPAPRLSRTPAAPRPAQGRRLSGAEALAAWSVPPPGPRA